MFKRLLVAVSIATVFALGYAGRAAIGAQAKAPMLARPLDARALVKKLDTLDARLAEAQARIDEVVVELGTVGEAERDATRVRLDVLYRLERGLTADIARTRGELAAVATR